jgi:hypothetical protein
MARIEWVKHRLENWALWSATMEGDGLGFSSQAAFLNAGADPGRYRETAVPIDEVEASVTDLAVAHLKLGHGHLHQTLRLFYVKGQGISGTARTMRRAESTVHHHLGQADALIATWFRERNTQRQDKPAQMVVQLLDDQAKTRLLAELAEEKRQLQLRRRPMFVGPPLPPVKRARPTLRLRGKLSSFTT